MFITIIVGTVFVNNSHQSINDTEPLTRINASCAIKIVANHSSAVAYMSSNFKVPDWRVVRATMVENTTYDINGSIIQEGNNFWKIEMMEPQPDQCGVIACDAGCMVDPGGTDPSYKIH